MCIELCSAVVRQPTTSSSLTGYQKLMFLCYVHFAFWVVKKKMMWLEQIKGISNWIKWSVIQCQPKNGRFNYLNDQEQLLQHYQFILIKHRQKKRKKETLRVRPFWTAYCKVTLTSFFFFGGGGYVSSSVLKGVGEPFAYHALQFENMRRNGTCFWILWEMI